MMQRTPFLLLLSQTWVQVKFLISYIIFATKEEIRMRGTTVHAVILTPVLQVFYCLCCCCYYYYYLHYHGYLCLFTLPVPVAARWVCGRSLAGIMGSNPAVGMDVSPLCVFCVLK